MAYLNYEDMKRKSETLFREKSIILASADFSRKSTNIKCEVFLSHSSKDEEILPGVIKFLEGFGVKVYIDKKDNALPKVTSPETAEILKQRIRESRKFIVLVTENSKDSRWIPWELGLADEMKKLNNIALLPAIKLYDNGSWTKQEYLGLYDRVELNRFKNQSDDKWIVVNHHENSGIELREWLKK